MSKNTLFLSSLGNKNAFTTHTPRIWHLLIILFYLVSLIGVPTGVVHAASTITFTGAELLGKPEDTSITINIIPASPIEYHYQYGTSSGSYSAQTSDYTATGGQPHEVVISGLTPNTQYYYRMQYHAPGDAMDDWVDRPEHTFWTQRTQGSSFSFTVTSDSHQNFNTAEQNAMTNIYNEHPDFLVDLGDTFLTDGATSQTTVNNEYLAYRKPAYFDRIGNSVPIFLASGNHENEEGWNLDDTFSQGLASILARKLYYPTPVTDSFYSGNTDPLAAINAATYGDQLREDYYAWTWGDALFVVIDEFQYTMNLPYAPGSAGEGNDDVQNGDQWSWTLGAQQYQWFKQTLQNSNARYKFVFSHQMLGGIPNLTVSGVGPGYVRGGCGAAPYFEWGGKNADGSAGFAAHRNPADFGTEPIHQLMMDNGVSAYFHGHDHQYVYETCDGIAYQEVPSPGMSGSGFGGIYTAGDHGTFQTVKILPNSGHLRISITPTQATVDYVSSTTSNNGNINYTYTIAPHTGGPTHVLTTAVNPAAGGTITPAAGTHSYNEGDVVNITATPAAGYTFTGWGGDCTGAGACSVTMDAARSVTANFTINTYTLSVTNSGSGTGTVTSNPAGITCGATCAADFNYNTAIALTATPGTGSVLTSWGGACSGSGACNVTMTAAASVTATFDTVTCYALTLGHTGNGSDPTASPANSPGCSPGQYVSGAAISLSGAVPSSGWQVSGWTGTSNNSSTASTNSLSMPASDRAVSVTYTLIPPNCYTLTISHTGQGSDPTASPLKSGACSTNGQFVAGEAITLNGATPTSGWQISGWTGTSNNTSTASSNSLTMPASPQAVSVTYTQIPVTCYALTLSHTGQGTNPTASPVKSSACSTNGQYVAGEAISLSGAVPASHWQIGGWTGTTNNSSTANANSLSMPNSAQSASVIYTQIEYTLATSVTGSGSITRNNPGPYHYGEVVQLTPVPESGWSFSAWGGDLSGSASPANITINGNKSVSATFVTLPANCYALTISHTGQGSDPVASPLKSTGCSSNGQYEAAQAISLSGATPASGSHISGWTGTSNDGSSASSNSLTMPASAKSVSVNYALDQLTYNLPLQIGWNLVSFNLHPVSTLTQDVLSGINGKYDLVYAWDAAGSTWMKYDPNSPPYASNLNNLDETMGFWIKMNTAATLVVSGTAPGTSTIDLYQGWNLVSFPATANLALPDVLRDHGVLTDFTLVYAYHASDTGDPWKLYNREAPAWANDLTGLTSGWGYWIKVVVAHPWDVTY